VREALAGEARGRSAAPPPERTSRPGAGVAGHPIVRTIVSAWLRRDCPGGGSGRTRPVDFTATVVMTKDSRMFLTGRR